jgi:hypothetical protein
VESNKKEIIDNTTEQERQSNNQQIEFVQIQTIERTAPLPSPSEMEGYKNVDKDFPREIMEMAKKEQRFRHTATYIGQIGFAVVILGGYAISGYVGMKNTVLGISIALGISYIAYVIKSSDPKPPKAK